jgi:hypothetical protein
MNLFEVTQRMPKVQLPYEMQLSRPAKIPPEYDCGFAVPQGNKSLLYMTETGSYSVGLNGSEYVSLDTSWPGFVSYGNVVLYGTVVVAESACVEDRRACVEDRRAFVEDRRAFVVEDVLFCKGCFLTGKTFLEKMPFLKEILLCATPWPSSRRLCLPFTFRYDGSLEGKEPTYPVHHYQFRASNVHRPYLNVAKSYNEAAPAQTLKLRRLGSIPKQSIVYHPNKLQYKLPTVFLVQADEEADRYHLYGSSSSSSSFSSSSMVYCGLAAVISLEHSQQMNAHFRRIRETENLDYIEESEDEDMFENMDCQKYVDLEKKLYMTCVFHKTFQKWVPLTVSEESRAIPTHLL